MKKLCPLLFAFTFFACQKDPVSVPVSFKETTYHTLAPFNSDGVPSNLLTPDNIPEDLLVYINQNLLEVNDLRRTKPELLEANAIADIKITKSSQVIITFANQFTNVPLTLGFYTYPTGNPPKEAKELSKITYIFPNAGRYTALKNGDRVNIGRFEAGTSIGFVILRNGWDRAKKEINKDAVHFLSTDQLNPEVDPKLKRHVVLLPYPPKDKLLIAFEDVDRTSPECDHDFNDLVIYATVTP